MKAGVPKAPVKAPVKALAITRGKTIAEAFAEALAITRGKALANAPAAATRKGIRLIFDCPGYSKEIVAIPDTGTYANHISLSLAYSLGFRSQGQCNTLFELPNGKFMQALGKFEAKVQFKADHPDKAVAMPCWFYVFAELATPTLMGLDFLIATQTLTDNDHRLEELPKRVSVGPYERPYLFCSMGEATNHVVCVAEGELAYAYADTGSEIALISDSYMMARDLSLESGAERIKFADGSIALTIGIVEIMLTIPVQNSKGPCPWKRVRFHVLPNCRHDLLLSEELVAEFALFKKTPVHLAVNNSGLIQGIAAIIHLGPLEKRVTALASKTKKWVVSKTTLAKDDQAAKTADSAASNDVSILESIAVLDQQENRNRIRASKSCYSITQARAELGRQMGYESDRAALVISYYNSIRDQIQQQPTSQAPTSITETVTSSSGTDIVTDLSPQTESSNVTGSSSNLPASVATVSP
ncbi:hypothetical protein C7974DRAFT_402520 [Boeremia exigua]|uniref:uncharacterized protein n=1 Tax=Boeremia exigua TaxID=749465 RepID=UPI001E8CE74E|nr:uncharacterized protein C7974DRAFT_402520 [Boeremia exigua]KAH6616831.1 hypothetical protein C7974DRAFT_402520 [Boeremia exigua]